MSETIPRPRPPSATSGRIGLQDMTRTPRRSCARAGARRRALPSTPARAGMAARPGPPRRAGPRALPGSRMSSMMSRPHDPAASRQRETAELKITSGGGGIVCESRKNTSRPPTPLGQRGWCQPRTLSSVSPHTDRRNLHITTRAARRLSSQGESCVHAYSRGLSWPASPMGASPAS